MTGSRSGVARWAEEIAEDGYSVAPGVFGADEVVALRHALDSVFRQEEALAVARGWVNDTYRVSYMLPAKSPDLLQVCWHPVLLELVRSVLGDDCVLGALNGLTPTPGGRGQDLHQDQDAPCASPILHVNAVCVLDAFTVENGATRVVPGSHRWTSAPTDVAALERAAVRVEADPGSVIGYSGALWHASGANRTSFERRALHAFYGRPWVVPHWDVPASLPDHVAQSLDATQRRVLGFESRPRRYDAVHDRIFR